MHHFVSGHAALMRLFWFTAALLPLASCSLLETGIPLPLTPAFDAVVSLQGSIPIDDGKEVPSGAQQRRATCCRPVPPARRQAHKTHTSPLLAAPAGARPRRPAAAGGVELLLGGNFTEKVSLVDFRGNQRVQQ